MWHVIDEGSFREDSIIIISEKAIFKWHIIEKLVVFLFVLKTQMGQLAEQEVDGPLKRDQYMV
jgi:hypothetical protein